MDRRTFVLGTAAAALHASRLSAWQGPNVELGSIDGSVGGNQFTPIQFLDYLSSIKLTWAMLSRPRRDAGRRGGDPTDPRARRPAGDQAAARARLGVPELAVVQRAAGHARSAGDARAQDLADLRREVHALHPRRRSRTAANRDAHRQHDQGRTRPPLAHRRLRREAGRGESRRRPAGARDEDDDRGGRHRRHGRLPRLGQPGVDARGSAHDARDADPLRRDVPRARQRHLDGAGRASRSAG